MKITAINSYTISKIKQSAKIFLGAAVVSFPLSCGRDRFVKDIWSELPGITASVEKQLDSTFVKGLKIVKNVNPLGGVTHCYNDSSMEVLRTKLIESGIKTKYTCPIDTILKPYIPSTGNFGSVRPYGRIHLGVDIYPRLYGRKPKQPVAVVSASDGIVVSVKKSPEKDPNNLIANNIKIMSPDGKIYSYDHLGRPEDYKGAEFTPLKSLGTVVHAGDTLGTVGRTGETAVWHLHFAVEDLAVKKEQLKNPTWQKLYKNYSVYATPRGQVDPLDTERAGGISEYLKKYRIDEGEKVSYLADL